MKFRCVATGRYALFLVLFWCSFLRKCFVQLARWMAVGWMESMNELEESYVCIPVECPVFIANGCYRHMIVTIG